MELPESWKRMKDDLVTQTRDWEDGLMVMDDLEQLERLRNFGPSDAWKMSEGKRWDAIRNLGRAVADFGADFLPGIGNVKAGQEAATGKRLLLEGVPGAEEQASLSGPERLAAGAAVVLPFAGLVKMHGIGKALVLASKYGGPDKVSMFLEGLRIPQRDWTNVDEIIAEGTAFWRGRNRTLNIGVQKGRTGILSHEMTHERFSFPESGMEEGLVKTILPASDMLNRAFYRGAFKKTPNKMDFWRLSPEEQSAIEMERRIYQAIKGNTPFNFTNNFIDAAHVGRTKALNYMENYLKGGYGEIPREGREVVEDAFKLQKKILGLDQPRSWPGARVEQSGSSPMAPVVERGIAEARKLPGGWKETKEAEIKLRDDIKAWLTGEKELPSSHKLPRMEERGEPWNLSTTDLPAWDQAMKGKSSTYNARLGWIAPETFLKKIAMGQKGKTMEQMVDSLSDTLIKEYTEEMLKGAKFPVPGLEYSSWGMAHEGRHRAAAAIKAGKKKMPVLVLKQKGLRKELP